jgi:hypothetical protein
MSKLLERLKDASRSGVYRTSSPGPVLEVVPGSGIEVARIDPRERPLFDAIGEALQFPDWFGRNWDALEDCLTDLSWRKAQGHVLLFESFAQGDELGVLIDVLGAAAQFWRQRRRPFFAVFVDPGRKLSLPDLYREA